MTVDQVIDGDTMKVQFPNGKTDEIRLIGVDTPDVNGQNDPAEFEGIPSTTPGNEWFAGWGDNASAYATDQLASQEVHIELGPESD